MTYWDAMAAASAEYWRQLLEREPNRTQAARIAGVHRSHLYRMIERTGQNVFIKPPKRGNWGNL